jgi:hypothetical protein
VLVAFTLKSQPVSIDADMSITTIEGLSPDGSHPVNLCRCGPYARIRPAVAKAAQG